MSSMESYSKIDKWQKKLESKLVERRTAEESVRQSRSWIKENERQLKHCEAAEQFLRDFSSKIQRETLRAIEDIATVCLQRVFGNEYQLVLGIDKDQVSIRVEKDGKEYDPLGTSGGGVIDMIAFGLRIASLLLSDRRRILILDEPFRFVSADYLPLAGELLTELAERYGIQLVIVTHSDRLVAGKVVAI